MNWHKLKSEPLSDRLRKRVIYSGRVQGVGFRATTHSIARNFDVAGYVRNLPDGSVELVAEGFPRELQSFLDAITEQMDGYIDSAEVAEIAAEGELQGFRIRY
jgi:acylphosphatase